MKLLQDYRNPAGFTLIEILVAMVIMSAILAAVYNTYLLAHRALFAMDESIVKLQEGRAFMDTLRREIESTFYSESDVYCVFRINDRDFYGRQASSLTLTTSSPLIKGLARINYAVEEKDGVLVITKSMVSAFSKTGEENRFDLLEDIESFELQARYGDKWIKTWESALTKNVPEEVRIILAIRMKNSRNEAASAAPCFLLETVKPKVGGPL